MRQKGKQQQNAVLVTAQLFTSCLQSVCGNRRSLYSLLWKEMITEQPVVEKDDHCTVYNQLWKEIITVQPTVERDTVQCTAYC